MSGTTTKSEGVIRTGLFRATAVVFAATLVSAIFGLLREVLIAWEFGTSTITDSYFFAFELATSVSLVLLGGMAPAMIAVYTSVKRQDRHDPKSDLFGSTVINVYVLGLIASSLIFAVAAPLVGPLLASGFAPDDREMVVKLMWCLTPTLLLSSVALILKSLLEAEQLFFVSQVSTAFLAVGVIATIVLFAGSWGVYCLPLGMLIGTSVQVVWTMYWLRRSGFRYQFALATEMLEFKRFLSVLWPGVIGALIMSVMPLIDKSMASHMAAGTVACLSFAARPMGLVARFGLSSLITALLPTFASIAVNEHPDQFRATVSQMLRIVIFVSLPVGILMVALRVPIIEALFERGNFSAESTSLTASIFAALAVGLCPMTITVAISTVFKSMQDTKTAAFVGGGTCLVSKVIFNLLLIAPLGAVGLALATSLQYVTSGFFLIFCLRDRLQGLGLRQLLGTTARVLVASSPAYLVVAWIVMVLRMPPLVVCVVGTLAGGLVFLAIAALLRIQELTDIYVQFAESQAVRRRLPVRLQRMLP